jgi:hypothetical protein
LRDHRVFTTYAAPDARGYPALPPKPRSAKADADAEKQIAITSAKMKLAEEYDRKEKNLAVELRMCVEQQRQRQADNALVY